MLLQDILPCRVIIHECRLPPYKLPQTCEMQVQAQTMNITTQHLLLVVSSTISISEVKWWVLRDIIILTQTCKIFLPTIYNQGWGEKVVLPLTGVLPSALAVEVVCTRYTGASVQAGVGGARAYANLTVCPHERHRTLAEVAWGIQKKILRRQKLRASGHL